MSDRETLNVYAARAQDYDRNFSRDTPDADLQRFIDAMPVGAQVLDLGCGPGAASGFMAQAGLKPEAWDPVPEMLALAAARPGVIALQAGYDDLTATHSYDGIWCNFSMLHTPLAQWPNQIARIRAALKPGGLFHMGTKLGSGEVRDKIGRLYSYMTEPDLTALITDTGFTIEHSRTGAEAGLSGEVAPFIILQARA
ncbi:MAG: class I SAM-dependent methyltransferase [Pseudomonadota bacterium]